MVLVTGRKATGTGHDTRLPHSNGHKQQLGMLAVITHAMLQTCTVCVIMLGKRVCVDGESMPFKLTYSASTGRHRGVQRLTSRLQFSEHRFPVVQKLHKQRWSCVLQQPSYLWSNVPLL